MIELCIESLEVDPIVGILQEAMVKVNKETFPLAEESMDDIRAIPHGFKLPFYSLIMGLVINEDEAPLAKGAWVDMGVIMGIRPSLFCFNHLERSMTVLIGFFKHK